MTEEYRWAIRGINKDITKRMRILAVHRDVKISALLNEALEQYLEREENGTAGPRQDRADQTLPGAG